MVRALKYPSVSYTGRIIPRSLDLTPYKNIKVEVGSAHLIGTFASATGDGGHSYYWSDGKDKSGNFDVIVSQRSYSILGETHPRFSKFAVKYPKGHDAPPVEIIDRIFKQWCKRVGHESSYIG